MVKLWKRIRKFLNIRKNKYLLRVINPDNLHNRKGDAVWSKDYKRGLIKNHGKEYYWSNVKNLGMCDEKGRRVKVWRLVKSTFDVDHDLYIPIYYKKKK